MISLCPLLLSNVSGGVKRGCFRGLYPYIQYPENYVVVKINESQFCPICIIYLIFVTYKLSYGVGMIRVDFGPISETVYIDIILNTIIER